MNENVQRWIDGGEEALRIAEQQLESERPLWAVFFCHLAVEKMLKAVVQHITEEPPPKTHSLPRLVALSKLSPSSHFLDFLGVLTELSVPTRYPEHQLEIRERFDRDSTGAFLEETKEVVKWIAQSLKS